MSTQNIDEELVLSSSDIESFENVFTPITIEELKGEIFALGEIYWEKASGKKIKLVDAGEAIDLDYLLKFEAKGAKFKLKRAYDSDVHYDGKNLFLKLRDAETEADRVEARDHILLWFRRVYWDGQDNGNLLDLMKIGSDSFHRFDPEFDKELQNVSLTLYKRSTLLASLCSITALILGHLDYKFLTDIYNLCYLFDLTFNKDVYSYNIHTALEQERVAGGEGKRFLRERKKEYKQFSTHPEQGEKEAKDRLAKYFHTPSILRLISVHHEKLNGTGFPTKLNQNEMSDFENAVIMLSDCLTYNEIKFTLNDGNKFYKELIIPTEKIDGGIAEERVRELISNEMAKTFELDVEQEQELASELEVAKEAIDELDEMGIDMDIGA